MATIWIGCNADGSEWYVMDGVEMVSGPHPSEDVAVEKMKEVGRAKAEKILRELRGE